MNDVIPADEASRLAAVRSYGVLDTEPEEPFDRITGLAARLLDMPTSVMTIIDADRVWFKSVYGVCFGEIPRREGMCSVTITGAHPYVITDAKKDSRWKDNPFVTGKPALRTYAGVPLRSPEGYGIGTLCVMDAKPREMSDDALSTLVDLASVAMSHLELRRRPAEGAALSWEEPPGRRAGPGSWDSLLAQVARRVGHWAKLRHYDGETSAYRAAAQLRERQDLPPGRWDFVARRSDGGGSDLYARLSGE